MTDPLYTVNRTQDGAEIRSGLTFDDAISECAILNAQARQSVGIAETGVGIYASMFRGEVCRYEVREAVENAGGESEPVMRV